MPISGSIDCTLITKAKLFKGTKKKNAEGKDPLYVNIILIETPNNQYADFMIVEALSKEEKERGMRQGKKLGTGKFFGNSSANKQTDYSPTEDLL
jgi:hypothetical protein